MSMFRSTGMRNVSKTLAHTTILPSLGNKDLKLLQDLITAEKFVVSSAQRFADDFAKASEALKLWGAGEGEDLGDILSQSRELLVFVSAALAQFATHETAIRVHMKAVRSREENLDEMKRRRKQVGVKAESADKKLSKMGPEHKHLPMQTDLLGQLQAEMRQLDSQILIEEARLSDYKRQTTKDWMALKFGGLAELAQKTVIVGDIGKQMIEEIPLEQTQPGYGRVQYSSHEQTQQLFDNAVRAINEVVFQPTTGNLSYHYEAGQVPPLPHSNVPPNLADRPGYQMRNPFDGGLPPGQEPHTALSDMGMGGGPDSPPFDRVYPSPRPGLNEFGQGPQSIAQSLGPASGGGGGGAYPPRTSSTRAEMDNGGSKFASMPNRTGWNLQDPGSPPPPSSSQVPLQHPQPHHIPSKDEPPLPSLPIPAPPNQSRFSAETVNPPRDPRAEVRHSTSGLSDSGADMVLAYYSTQESGSPVQEHGGASGASAYRGASPSEENPYAEDAYNASSSPARQNHIPTPSVQPPPRQQSLGLANIQPLRPRSASDLRAANAAAARDIAREIDGSSISTDSTARPLPQHQPRQDTAPPTLSLSFTDDSGFDFAGLGSATSPTGGGRSRSPPPSFEVAMGTPQPREMMLPSEPFPPQSQPLPQPDRNLSLATSNVSRSESAESTSSSLSTLPTPNPPFRSVTPSRGTTTSMPGSPTEPGSPTTPKTISAAAFKRFRGPSVSPATASGGGGTTTPEMRRKAPPLVANDSSASGVSHYTSAPSTPAIERTASDTTNNPHTAYNPSPLSTPYTHGEGQDASFHSRVSYMSSIPSPYEGDPHAIGMAVGSPGEDGPGGTQNHRLTIGDAGWRPGMPGRMPSSNDGGGSPSPGRNGGYQNGRYTTALE